MNRSFAQKIFNENIMLKEKLKKIKELVEGMRLECSDEMLKGFKGMVDDYKVHTEKDEKDIDFYNIAAYDGYRTTRKVAMKYFDNLYSILLEKGKSVNS